MRIRTLMGIALVVVAVLGLTACGGGEEEPAPTNTPTATATPPSDDGGTNTGGDGAVGEVVSVELTENPYLFVPDTLSFSAGTTYTLSFNAPNEFHTFTVRDLGIDIFINAGEAVEASITPSGAGDYELTCVPHEGLGMVGTVSVM